MKPQTAPSGRALSSAEQTPRVPPLLAEKGSVPLPTLCSGSDLSGELSLRPTGASPSLGKAGPVGYLAFWQVLGSSAEAPPSAGILNGVLYGRAGLHSCTPAGDYGASEKWTLDPHLALTH